MKARTAWSGCSYQHLRFPVILASLKTGVLALPKPPPKKPMKKRPTARAGSSLTMRILLDTMIKVKVVYVKNVMYIYPVSQVDD